MSSSSEQQLKQSEITKNHFSFHHSSSNATSDSFPLEPVVLGEGSFSSVYLATHKPSGRVCALKCVYKKELMRQAARQQQSSHRTTVVDLIKREKFVLQLVGGLIKPKRFHFGSDIGDGSDGDDTTIPSPPNYFTRLLSTFQDDACLWFCLEFVDGGDLCALIRKTGGLSSRACRRLSWQLISALDWLHRLVVVHRDLKPENILLTGLNRGDLSLKLADFGQCKFYEWDPRLLLDDDCAIGGANAVSFDESSLSGGQNLHRDDGGNDDGDDDDDDVHSNCGTAEYSAPELLDSNFFSTKLKDYHPPSTSYLTPNTSRLHRLIACDLWSLGCVLYEMMTNRYAFRDPPGSLSSNETNIAAPATIEYQVICRVLAGQWDHEQLDPQVSEWKWRLDNVGGGSNVVKSSAPPSDYRQMLTELLSMDYRLRPGLDCLKRNQFFYEHHATDDHQASLSKTTPRKLHPDISTHTDFPTRVEELSFVYELEMERQRKTHSN